MNDAVDLDFRKLYFAASFMLESAEGEGGGRGPAWEPRSCNWYAAAILSGMKPMYIVFALRVLKQ